MTTSEKYQHMLSVVEKQITAEAYNISMYEKSDPESAADAQARWDNWATLYDAISEGLLDDVKAENAKYRALIGGAA